MIYAFRHQSLGVRIVKLFSDVDVREAGVVATYQRGMEEMRDIMLV